MIALPPGKTVWYVGLKSLSPMAHKPDIAAHNAKKKIPLFIKKAAWPVLAAAIVNAGKNKIRFQIKENHCAKSAWWFFSFGKNGEYRTAFQESRNFFAAILYSYDIWRTPNSLKY